MKNLLFCLPLKPNALPKYEQFVETCKNEKRNEWIDLLKRYDMHTVKIWHKTLENKEYIFVYHDIGEKAHELLANWANSEHAFDQWFGQQLSELLDANAAEDPARSLFEMVI